MEETRMFTDVEILRDAVGTLERLMVPVNQMESIGFPILRTRNNLKALLEAIEAKNAEKAEETTAEAEEE